MAKGIKFNGTVAMPGSELYGHLTDKNPESSKKAEKSYKITHEMHRKHVTKEMDDMLVKIRTDLFKEHQELNELRKNRNGN